MNNQMVLDSDGFPVQGFVPNPSLSLVSSTLTGNMTFTKSGAGDSLDIKGLFALQVNCLAASSYYYNGESTKLFPLPSGEDYTIFVGYTLVTSVTIQFGTAVSTNCMQKM